MINIGSIQTKEAFTFGDYVQPICLPDDDADVLTDGKKAWLTGWGYPKSEFIDITMIIMHAHVFEAFHE